MMQQNSENLTILQTVGKNFINNASMDVSSSLTLQLGWNFIFPLVGWEHYLFQIWLLLQFESFAINDKHVLNECEEKDWNGSSSKAVSESVNEVSLV